MPMKFKRVFFFVVAKSKFYLRDFYFIFFAPTHLMSDGTYWNSSASHSTSSK